MQVGHSSEMSTKHYVRLVFWPFFKKTQGKITQGIEKTQAIFQNNSSKKAEKLKIRQFWPNLVAGTFLSKFFLVSKWRFYLKCITLQCIFVNHKQQKNKKLKDFDKKLKDFDKELKDFDKKLKEFCHKLNNPPTLSWCKLQKNGQKTSLI